MRNRFLACTKAAFKKGTPAYPLLDEGFIVVQLTGLRAGISEDDEFRDILAEILGDSGSEELRKTLWYHLGHVSFCPYEPTFLPMQQCDSIAADTEIDLKETVFL